MTEERNITVQDAAHAGYCVKGQREFMKKNGIEWRDYVRNGLPVEVARELTPGQTAQILKVRRSRDGQA